MIEVPQMTEFVNDHIIPFFRSKKSDAIVKGKIPRPRTASEARPLITNGDLFISEVVKTRELPDTILDEILRFISLLDIFR